MTDRREEKADPDAPLRAFLLELVQRGRRDGMPLRTNPDLIPAARAAGLGGTDAGPAVRRVMRELRASGVVVYPLARGWEIPNLTSCTPGKDVLESARR